MFTFSEAKSDMSKLRISSLVATACALNPLFVKGAPAEEKRLNVVFFLVDDMGWKDSSCYGSELYETPNMDRLAQEGVRFTQAYTAHPRCVPARYALLTGKFPARAGIPGASYNMEASEFTLAEAVKEDGYATFFAGKWHLMKTDDQLPENQGFDVNIAGGHAGAPPSYFYPYNQTRSGGHKAKKLHGLDEGTKGEYLTDRLTEETIEFLERHHTENPDQPFFVYLSHYAVHTPLEAKPELVEHYKKKIGRMSFDGPAYVDKDGTTKMRQDNAVYAAMVHSMDESLGRVMETLDQLSLSENTIIVFTSDHGGLSNRGVTSKRPLATSNLPLRAGKGHCYEGGIRVPLIVKWPGVTRAGMVSGRVVAGTDHYPTILKMAGLPPRPEQHLDGVSYADTLNGAAAVRPGPMFWHSPVGRPASTGDTNCSVIREGDWKLLEFYDEDRVELYNVVDDPYETADLSEKEPDRAAELLKKIQVWKREISAFTK